MESPAPPAAERRAPEGRVAVPEIAELLHLQRPAAAVAAAVVVLVGLVVALIAPELLPPNVVTGFVVGLVALFAAAVAAVVLDGRDPILRGPRHLRRDGHTVLARMAGPDPIEHGGAVLAALERRLAERDHLSIALTGSGTDPSGLAVAIGRAAAADGHTALVVDLRAAGAPGVADVGAGTVRLGEAAQLAADRPYAWISAGTDRERAVSAAATVARRPPRDLALLLVVAPEAATHAPDLLRACDRTVLLVAADSQQRAMVSARLEALQRAGGRPEAIVVGGLHVPGGAPVGAAAEDDTPARPTPGGPFARDREAMPSSTPLMAEATPATPAPPAPAPSAPASRAVPSPPGGSPATDAGDAPQPHVADADEATDVWVGDIDAAAAARAPVEDEASPADDQPTARGPEDEAEVASDVAVSEQRAASERRAAVAAAAAAELDELAADVADVADSVDAAEADDTADAAATDDDAGPADAAATDDDAGSADAAATDDDAGSADAAATDEGASDAESDAAPPAPLAPPPPPPALDDTGPISPLTFRDAGPEDDEPAEGFASSDPLVTTAALEQLLRDQDRED